MIVGVGPGLGAALAQRFVEAGLSVAVAARNLPALTALAAALRGLAQSMARELQPRGLHVAHVVIDGPIESEQLRQVLAERDPESFLKPDDVAEAFYQLHRQSRSAWTHELDLRSWRETF